MEDDLDVLTIPSGTVIHLYGMPLRIDHPIAVLGKKANFTTTALRSPEYAGCWHRIDGPVSDESMGKKS